MASFWEETKLAAQELFGKNETKLLKKRVHVRFDALICCISHCTTLPSPPSVPIVPSPFLAPCFLLCLAEQNAGLSVTAPLTL